MMLRSVPLVVLSVLIAACTENTSPGNDREAELSQSEPPSEVAAAGAAIEGVAADLLFPQTMTDADGRNIPDGADGCLFRFTRVGLPVLAYGSVAVVKLNDRLVSLPGAGEGRYAAEGVTVTVRPLSDRAGDGEPFVAELVLHVTGAAHERGYHGFSECNLPGA